jgi:hypothetical protein
MIVLNKRNITNSNFWSDLDNLGWSCLATTTTWPTHDLMLTPTSNAKNLQFSNVSGSSVTVSWANGNGSQRLLLAKADNPVDAFPLDGTDYTANSVFGSGSTTGNSNYVLYNGTGNTVTVSGLAANKKYHFRLIEFNKNSSTGNNSLYLLGANAKDYTITASSFTFNGSGNWSNSSNWSNGLIPPTTLPSGVQIIINPTGSNVCVLDVVQRVPSTSSVTVQAGKKLTIQGNLLIQ